MSTNDNDSKSFASTLDLDAANPVSLPAVTPHDRADATSNATRRLRPPQGCSDRWLWRSDDPESLTLPCAQISAQEPKTLRQHSTEDCGTIRPG